MQDVIICPGCGWIGDEGGLAAHGDCPRCGYENGCEPFRLLSLGEMIKSNVEYVDVRFDLFLRSLLLVAGNFGGLGEEGKMT